MPKRISTNDPVPEILGANVREYRLLARLEQEDIAERMRLTGHPWCRQTVSEIERAQRNTTVSELVELAAILDASVNRLLEASRATRRNAG